VDCGTHTYPASSRLVLLYDTPESWQEYSDGPAPLASTLHLRGPYVPEWLHSPLYLNCPGEPYDFELGAVNPGVPGTRTDATTLPLGTLFGGRERFEVEGGVTTTRFRPLPEGATGFTKVKTDLRWTVTFTRLARRPR
jgi:hypothetical protein